MMQIRPPDLEIPPDDPFRNDALERAKLEPPLTEFVCQARGAFVLAIDGGWGTGKTTFIRMWREKLAQRGCKCLYFNAWETDFAVDPLVALVGEISASITGNGTRIATTKKRLKALAGSIVRRSIPVTVRLVTHGLVDLESTAEEIVADAAAEVAKDQIENYDKAKSDLASFRKALGMLVSRVSEHSDDSFKVVIFVDELDRCRPSYAVELLERIKHLFDVQGVVFVLGVDRRQLSHSVRVLYGPTFDAEGYLLRFIDLDYRLPDPPPALYCKSLFEILGIRQLILSRGTTTARNEVEFLVESLGVLLAAARSSLRQQLQMVTRLRVVLQTIPRNEYLFEESLAVLVFLRGWRPDLYGRLVQRDITLEEVHEVFDSLALEENSNSFGWRSFMFEATLIGGGSELKIPTPRLERYQQLAKEPEGTPGRHRAIGVLEALQFSLRHFRRLFGFAETIKRLELTKAFLPAAGEMNPEA